MDLITIRELYKNTEKYAGQEIEVGGWVRNRRPSKTRDPHPQRKAVSFPVVRGPTGP